MLQGRTAIITGSTSGIGLGIAHSLAKAKCNVVINGLCEPNEADKILNDLKKHKVKAIYDSANMRSIRDIANMVDTTVQTFGQVDILINNAGIQYTSPFTNFLMISGRM